jgi:hypothetical protein
MGKRGGVFNTMDFRTKLICLLSFLISNKVILERGLDPLIISIFVPLFPWNNLWNIIIWHPEVASVVNVLRISVSLSSLHFHFLHLCRQSLYHLCQFIHLRVRCRRTYVEDSYLLLGMSLLVLFLSRSTTNKFDSTSTTESCM